MDTQIIIDFLSKNREWVFSGVGVTIIFGGIGVAISIAFFLKRWLQNAKTPIAVFQEDSSIWLHNGSKRTIDVHFVSFTLRDISCPKELTRPPALPIYCKPERPVDAGQNAKIADIGKVFMTNITEYTKDDREAFRLQFPDYVFPVLLGLDIAVDFSILGSFHVKRTIIKRILSGYQQHGLAISKNPYGKDSTMPTRIRIKEKTQRFIGHVKNPIEWWHHRKQMRLVRAQLTFDCIFKALHYGVISEGEAEARMNSIRASLDAEERDVLEAYLKRRMSISG